MDRESAFEAYVAERRAHLFRTACVLCGDPHRAEDIVQDALSKLYVAWPRVMRDNNVDGYVRRILVNANHDQRRRPWRREVLTDPGDRPAPPALSSEDSDLVWAALRSLPIGQRKVVVLRHFWGLTVEETASELSISTGTVKSQTSEAVTKLRRLLSTDFGPSHDKEDAR
jgi:RNA polymerase sigma-70 factor (sigma-E family)